MCLSSGLLFRRRLGLTRTYVHVRVVRVAQHTERSYRRFDAWSVPRSLRWYVGCLAWWDGKRLISGCWLSTELNAGGGRFPCDFGKTKLVSVCLLRNYFFFRGFVVEIVSVYGCGNLGKSLTEAQLFGELWWVRGGICEIDFGFSRTAA